MRVVDRLGLAILLIGAVFLSTSFVKAEDDALEEENRGVEAVTLPKGIPALPSPREKETSFLLTTNNLQSFQPILLAPLSYWIKDGRLVVRVVKSLDFYWQLAQDWKRGSLVNLDRLVLAADRSLKAVEPPAEQGYPFGFATNINREKDPVAKAYQILWNVEYNLAAGGELLYDLELSWIGNKGMLRKATGIYFRRTFAGRIGTQSSDGETQSNTVPQPIDVPVSGPGDLLSQEVLKLGWPPVVFGFSQIGWRYRGVEDDKLWVHSPVVGSNRELFGSNRSDPLLGGLLTYDDLQVWSTKIQSVSAKVVDEKVMLLPFPSLNLYRLTPERMIDTGQASNSTAGDGLPPALGTAGRPVPKEEVHTIRGYHRRNDSSSATVLWNYETGEFPQAAPWVPTTAYLVPRKVWILEIRPRDPFYLTGRQVLVVDQESMLPVYKVIFNQGGDYQRTVLGGWALASTEDGSNRFPFIGFVVVVDNDPSRAMLATTQSVRNFRGSKSKVALEYRSLLDISSYAVKKRSEESAENTTERMSTRSGTGAADDDSTANLKNNSERPKLPPQEPGEGHSGSLDQGSELDSEAGPEDELGGSDRERPGGADEVDADRGNTTGEAEEVSD